MSVPTANSILRHRRESAAIAQAIADFWAGLIPALKATGAKVKRETGKQEIEISETETITVDNSVSNRVEINGEVIYLDIRPHYQSAGRFSTGPWTGTIAVTLREYRYQNAVWKTRKTGWPFKEIAEHLVGRANAAIARQEASEKRETERLSLQKSAAWKDFEKRAHEISLYPYAEGSQVKLDLGKVSFAAAQAILEVLEREEAGLPLPSKGRDRRLVKAAIATVYPEDMTDEEADMIISDSDKEPVA